VCKPRSVRVRGQRPGYYWLSKPAWPWPDASQSVSLPKNGRSLKAATARCRVDVAIDAQPATCVSAIVSCFTTACTCDQYYWADDMSRSDGVCCTTICIVVKCAASSACRATNTPPLSPQQFETPYFLILGLLWGYGNLDNRSARSVPPLRSNPMLPFCVREN
jgi:hypothetical protein